MRQIQFYKYATWGLLLLNLVMVAFFLLNKPKRLPPPRDGGRAAEITARDGIGKTSDILKLEGQQQDVFSNYAEQHIRQMEGFDKQQRNLLKLYFNTLIDSTGNIDADSLLVQASQLELKKIETTYQHLQDIKSILKPDQQAYYEAFMGQILRILLSEQNNSPPPPPRGN